jgi:transcriptional regulator with GAF, ATPase, and Fis domain
MSKEIVTTSANLDASAPLRHVDEDAALRTILEGTATETGDRFFVALVENLQKALATHGAWVTEYVPDRHRLKALAFLMDGEWIHNYEFEIENTPCEAAIQSKSLVHFPDRLLDLYPHDPDIRASGFVSYLGAPLLDVDGAVLGHLAVIDRRPIPKESRVQTIFQIFAARAAAELRRLRAETENLRNVRERLEAERKMRTLAIEAETLREELKELHHFDEILGKSQALVSVLSEVEQVAQTDTTVVILGETGTGKELVARAIHRASLRCDAPLIKVNCAAIPAALMESEFFGHVKGAFTGATDKREGRFSLADSGTIFLDEVGELPLDLQSKLLRVLQDGEFEPVGSSKSQKVDVRVIAATNRDLKQAVAQGKFREDLYYRLYVFPIALPPLRERGEDVVHLATAFAERFAKKMQRTLEPLTVRCAARLRAYNWPGNVRELENVIERAVITARDGRLNLDRALPETDVSSAANGDGSSMERERGPIHTMQELENLERQNLIRALETTGWRVSGSEGAAQLLGMKPSTLSSRMKALGIQRPQ